MKINFDSIPDTLKALDQWGLHRNKVPHQPSGQKAKANDPETWSSFEDAKAALRTGHFDGLTFAFSDDDLLVGIDLDDAVHEDGTLTPEAREVITSVASYTEWSPSRRGVHIIAQALKPGERCRTKKVNGMKELEMYDDRRFFTVTGWHVDGAPESIERRPKEVKKLYNAHLQKKTKTLLSSRPTPSASLSLTDREIIEKAKEAKNGPDFTALWNGDTAAYGDDHSRADLALCSKLAFWTGGDAHRIDALFRQSGLMRKKWDRDDYRDRTISKALEGLKDTYDPDGRSNGRQKSRSQKLLTFWFASKKGVRIDRAALLDFLEGEGFGKAYLESDLESSFIRIQENVVERTSAERMKDHVLSYVASLPPEAAPDGDYTLADVRGALLRGARVYFSSSLLEALPVVPLDFKRDTRDTAFFYYRNGFVEVDAEGFELHPYTDLDGHIWRGQIIERRFTDRKGDNAVSTSDWAEFLRNVTGGGIHRHEALCSAIGYLLHGYKDPTCAKAVVLMDERDSDVPEGRTGKSIIGKAIGHLTPRLRLDARNFSFDSRFRFQDVTLGTRVVDFNDARRRFDFERLFSVVTDSWTVERKGKMRVEIPFADAPRIMISTNYVLGGQGGSFTDRVFQIEFAPHYSKNHRPIDDFGRMFFAEWDAHAWAAFDNIMLACVRTYLKDGLHDYTRINVRRRRLKQATCKDFAEWVLDHIEPGTQYSKDDLWRSFRNEYAPDYDDLKKSKFGYWTSTFARLYGLEKERKQPTIDGQRISVVTFQER